MNDLQGREPRTFLRKNLSQDFPSGTRGDILYPGKNCILGKIVGGNFFIRGGPTPPAPDGRPVRWTAGNHVQECKYRCSVTE